MKNFAKLMGVVVVALGVAATAHGKDEKAAAPAPAAKKEAAAQPKKAPEPMPPDDGKMAKKPVEPPPAPAGPVPGQAPAEVAAMAKGTVGTWKCTGTVAEMDGTTMRPSTMTYSVKVDTNLDKVWLVAQLAEKKSKETPAPYKMTVYRTYDAMAKKWVSVSLDNVGSSSRSTSAGLVDNKISWEGKGEMGPMTMWSKDYEEMKGAKEVHMWGEMSMDGKKWMPAYDMTCKK